jgi:hypothetical protein
VLVLFFLLISGEMFLRRLVEILPTFKNKRQAVDISNQIESDISAYLLTITLMNAAVGIATGAAVALTGLGDPLLWGTIAFLLNFVPILGPMIAVVIFLVAGLLSIEPLWLAFVPAGLYLGIHIIGGRDHHADAPRAPLHYKSSASHRLAGFLVLDVGRTGSNPCDANAGDYQDRLRPHRVANTVRAFHRGLTAGKLHRENLGEACGDYTSWFRRAYDMAVAALASSRLRHRQGASITFAPNRRVIHRNSA